MPNLADLRRDFASHELLESMIAVDPFEQFKLWFDDALASDVIDANAMTVATVGDDGKPSVRVVLLKGYDESGFVFFTNYGSKKGTDLIQNPNTVFHFFWPQLDRQIGIYGSVEKTSREESDEYFHSRPVDSQIGAWASAQSSVIGSREELEGRFAEYKEKFGDDVPLPEHWGGFRLTPIRFEFWQGRQNRLHDRICYTLVDGDWKISRLSP
ncbi:MAG TPA: pyridoxamine 5'-phosphate oxidase [Pyrinomonadaceae bacterium]|nr:pyridoxamine 5'-phosphate oxidase [Pyrinomonadaceae bacterium]